MVVTLWVMTIVNCVIEVTKKAQKEILEKLSIQEKNLEFLGGGREDSDGIVYSYQRNGKQMVLKILAFKADEEHAIDDLKVRVQYANFLGEHGIKLAYPLVNENGNLYETSFDNNHYIRHIAWIFLKVDFQRAMN